MIIDGRRLGVFHECGMICIVEIVADRSDNDWERFDLKNLGVVQSSAIVGDPEADEVFEVEGTTGRDSAYKGWFLDEDGEGVARVLNNAGLGPISKKSEKPWEQPNGHGELPGDICCQRACSEFCYEHDRDNYPEGRFPIQGGSSIPWSDAEQAYKYYVSRFGNSQSLERLAERGGFGTLEFCILYLGLKPFETRSREREYEVVARVASMLGGAWRFEVKK